jgi:type III secretion protein Q
MNTTATQVQPADYAAAASRAAQPLRGRLPTLDAAQALTMRGLFEAARTFDAGNGLRMGITVPGALPRELVECEAGGECILLGIARDEILDPGVDAEWNDDRESARCAVWALAHERLLHALSHLLGHALLPRRMSVASTPQADAIWFGLRARAQHAQSIGVVAVPPALAQALVDTLRVRGTPAKPTPRIDAGRLREILLLSAAGPQLDACNFADLCLGDVVVLGTWTSTLTNLLLERTSHRSARWLASWREGRVHVRGIAASGYARSSSVNDTAFASGTRETSAPTAGQSHPPQISVALEFELGAVDISLRELAHIEPGYVFDLRLQLDHAVVMIRSAGRRIGRGELVAIDDTLGVRLTEWFAEQA